LYYAKRDEEALQAVALPPHERWISETSGLFSAFVSHVVDGMPLQCSGRDHLMSLAMLEACIQSSRTHTSIRVQDVLPNGATV